MASYINVSRGLQLLRWYGNCFSYLEAVAAVGDVLCIAVAGGCTVATPSDYPRAPTADHHSRNNRGGSCRHHPWAAVGAGAWGVGLWSEGAAGVP